MSWNPLQVLVKNRSLQIFFYKQFPFFSNSNFLFYTFLQKKNKKEKIFKSRYILSKCQRYKNKQSWQIEYLLSFSNKILTFSETRFQPGVDLSKWKIYNMKRCYQKNFDNHKIHYKDIQNISYQFFTLLHPQKRSL